MSHSEANLDEIHKAGIRETQINKELMEQPELISMINNALSDLEGRLKAVLVPENTDVEPQKAEVREVLVPMADHLHSNNERLHDIRIRISRIIDRLEL